MPKPVAITLMSLAAACVFVFTVAAALMGSLTETGHRSREEDHEHPTMLGSRMSC